MIGHEGSARISSELAARPPLKKVGPRFSVIKKLTNG